MEPTFDQAAFNDGLRLADQIAQAWAAALEAMNDD